MQCQLPASAKNNAHFRFAQSNVCLLSFCAGDGWCSTYVPLSMKKKKIHVLLVHAFASSYSRGESLSPSRSAAGRIRARSSRRGCNSRTPTLSGGPALAPQLPPNRHRYYEYLHRPLYHYRAALFLPPPPPPPSSKAPKGVSDRYGASHPPLCRVYWGFHFPLLEGALVVDGEARAWTRRLLASLRRLPS